MYLLKLIVSPVTVQWKKLDNAGWIGDFFLKTIYHFTYNVGSAVSRAGTLS